MFNKTLVLAGGGPSHVTHDVDITVKRAPTDESVRLLKEMEEAARQKILQALALEGNGFNAVAHAMRDPESDKNIFTVIFDLNGKRIETKYITDTRTKFQDVIDGLREAVAKDIAARILEAAFKSIEAKHLLGLHPSI